MDLRRFLTSILAYVQVFIDLVAWVFFFALTNPETKRYLLTILMVPSFLWDVGILVYLGVIAYRYGQAVAAALAAGGPVPAFPMALDRFRLGIVGATTAALATMMVLVVLWMPPGVGFVVTMAIVLVSLLVVTIADIVAAASI